MDSYVKWKISDFGRFYTSTGGGDYAQAANLLSRKVNDRLRSEIGSRTIKDIVSGTWRINGRGKKALSSGQDSTAELGIEVIDVRVKQINLPDEVSSSITNVCVQNVMQWHVNIVLKGKKKQHLFKLM